jgi:thiosulfate/3-mercaptopyruvate sulfurtransferase
MLSLMLLACGPRIQGLEVVPWDDVVVDQIDDAQVLDARTLGAFRAGHVPGAAHVHWRELTGLDDAGLWGPLPPEELAALLGQRGISHDAPVVLIGEGPEGYGDAGNVYWALRWLDHPDVRVLSGGMLGWVAEGHEPVQGPGPEPTVFTPGHDPAVFADTQDVAEWEGLVLDVRSRREFAAGRVPGAVWQEWSEVFNGPALHSQEVVAAQLAAVGADGSVPVVAYCEAGIRAGHSFMVLDALGVPAANYVGSWSRWTAEQMPVER